MWKFLLLGVLFRGTLAQETETDGQAFVDEYDAKVGVLWNENGKAAWEYYTNITDHNLEVMTNSSLKMAEFDKEIAANASKFDYKSFSNETLKRLFTKIVNIGFAATNDSDQLKAISNLEADLTGIYSKGEVCLESKGCLQLEPGLTDIITNSRDYNELLAVWKGWRDASGKLMRNKYTDFVKAMNAAIKFSDFNDTGEYWRSWYETPTFEQDVKTLFEELEPLYVELHAYVRKRLKQKYGKEMFPESGHIPAHLFGNMWAQQWSNIYDLLVPFPDASSMDITSKMIEQNYNVTHMYRVAEDFFMSIGMEKMTDEFWQNSMLVKPDDRDVVCHASAWDFYDGKDFRIKQCTAITEDQLLTVHHEMGHIVYYQNYKHLPRLFRRGANPGFHEGMADIVSLSFQTPEHMHVIGLLDNVPNDADSDINFLLKMALDKVAFLPFGYLIDQWRWSVFRGETNSSNYNQHWWDLRCRYQGISPPVQRTEQDFDPGAKYHIPGNTPYIRYFVSFVVQFQWHKALCEVAGNTKPLHRCDIYKNTDAGDKLREMLMMGSSKQWQDAMEAITGQRLMSAKPLVEYFDPLLKWLKEQNKEDNTGWSASCPSVIPTPQPLSAGSTLEFVSITCFVLCAVFAFLNTN
ncbi:angiotensin-converting enzyme-like isoform X2 [Ostrea edulis]|uniref:angiotensin-converting enzyme-like isoform X2 n=1 Tax=Ostrea edulis TaxID=37623 RepID=UPI0024AFF06E|nr:angiotensin-converting enzyme-like isoform X2 [Ostrea edulis]